MDTQPKNISLEMIDSEILALKAKYKGGRETKSLYKLKLKDLKAIKNLYLNSKKWKKKTTKKWVDVNQ